MGLGGLARQAECVDVSERSVSRPFGDAKMLRDQVVDAICPALPGSRVGDSGTASSNATGCRIAFLFHFLMFWKVNAKCAMFHATERRSSFSIACSRLPRRRAFHRRGIGTVVMSGAVSKMIDDLKERGGLKGMDVANIATVSPATVSRWISGKAFPHPKYFSFSFPTFATWWIDLQSSIRRMKRGSGFIPSTGFSTANAQSILSMTAGQTRS